MPRRHPLLTASHNVTSNKSGYKRFIWFGINGAAVGFSRNEPKRRPRSGPHHLAGFAANSAGCLVPDKHQLALLRLFADAVDFGNGSFCLLEGDVRL